MQALRETVAARPQRAHGDPPAEVLREYVRSWETRDLESLADQEATVLLGTDDGAKLWVNDKLVHTTAHTRAAAPEQETVKVMLRKGVNRIVLKINNGDGGHGFYFTLMSEQELKAVPLP